MTSIESKRRPVVRLVVVPPLLLLPVAGCAGPSHPRQSQADRMNAAFDRDAAAVKQKEGLPSAPSAHLPAGTTQLTDGTRVSLWVSDPAAGAGVKSRCYYLDLETSASAGGAGGCGMPGTEIVLDRNGGAIVGSVGSWPARSVAVEAADATAQCPQWPVYTCAHLPGHGYPGLASIGPRATMVASR